MDLFNERDAAEEASERERLAHDMVKLLEEQQEKFDIYDDDVQKLRQLAIDLQREKLGLEMQRDELLEACEGVVARVESRMDEHGEKCPMCGDPQSVRNYHTETCPYVAIEWFLRSMNG
jgi:hypothetical protein